MIIQATKPSEVMALIGIEDDVEVYFPCTRIEWIQFLVKHCGNPKFAIFISMKNEREVNGYAVVANNIFPPLSYEASLIFVWVSGGFEISKALSETVRVWAKERGCKKLVTRSTKPDRLLSFHEFKVVAKIAELEL